MIFEALNSLTEQAYTDSVSEIGPSTNRDHLLPLPTRLIEGIDFHRSAKKSVFQTMQPENLHRGHRSRWGRALGCMDHTPGAAKRTAPRKVWSLKTPWSRCYAEVNRDLQGFGSLLSHYQCVRVCLAWRLGFMGNTYFITRDNPSKLG